MTILTVGGVHWHVTETLQRMFFIPHRGFLQGGTLEGKHAELSGQAWAYSLFSSVAHLCLTLCNPMDYSTPGLPVHRQLLEFTQTHVH